MLPSEVRIPELPELIPRNHMSSIAKIQHKGQVTIPTRLRDKAGLAKGDLVEFSFQRGKIVITPKVVIDRSKFPTADDEYTPAQRRIIDAGLAQSAEDLRKGRTLGPFNTATEMIASMKKELKKRAASKQPKRAR
jgi:AbrB family looped-hinge helix DNA binding protein